MKRLIIALAAVAAVAAVAASSGLAAQQIVSLAPCLFGTGQRFVPAGTEPVLRAGWGDAGKGLVKSFIDATTVTASIDSNPVANAGSYWGPIERSAGSWLSFWLYPTGITLANPGDQMVVYYSWYLDRKVRAVQGDHGFAGPGEFWPANTCTITAT